MKKLPLAILLGALAAMGAGCPRQEPASGPEALQQQEEDSAAAINKDLEEIKVEGLDEEFKNVDQDTNQL